MRLALPFVLLVLAAAPGRAQTAAPHSYVPPHGFVPDSATAVRIAVAVWIPIYGEHQKHEGKRETHRLPPARPNGSRLSCGRRACRRKGPARPAEARGARQQIGR